MERFLWVHLCILKQESDTPQKQSIKNLKLAEADREKLKYCDQICMVQIWVKQECILLSQTYYGVLDFVVVCKRYVTQFLSVIYC